jgi:hypothetical protein
MQSSTKGLITCLQASLSACKSIIKLKVNTRTKIDNTKDNTNSNKSVFALTEKQKQAWKLIYEKHNQRTSLATNLNNLRNPGYVETGFYLPSPEANNRSDTYHRFLQRRALSKVNLIVSTWREIICQKPCCEDKVCTEECCVDKSDKKFSKVTWQTKRRHLYASLRNLGEEASQWKFCIDHKYIDIVSGAMNDICMEGDWLKYENIVAKQWEESSGWVKGQMDDSLESMGTSCKAIKKAEENLREVGIKEMVRIEDQEPVEAEKSSTGTDDDAKPDIGSDSELDESDDDEYPHLYADIPTPSSSSTNIPTEEYAVPDGPKVLFQISNDPITPPLTPIIDVEPASQPSDFLIPDDVEYLEPGNLSRSQNPPLSRRKMR